MRYGIFADKDNPGKFFMVGEDGFGPRKSYDEEIARDMALAAGTAANRESIRNNIGSAMALKELLRVLDEGQHVEELKEVLRGLIDKYKNGGPIEEGHPNASH